jgi:hypothetical protein
MQKSQKHMFPISSTVVFICLNPKERTLFLMQLVIIPQQFTSTVEKEKNEETNTLRLEHDLLMNIVGEKHVYMYETTEFWMQLKAAG